LYEDDTERFFADLSNGTPISLFCAPAARSNLEQWDKVLALLKKMGVNKIYDVSLGADICTWAYIRYIQKHNPPSVISQPCPAIVDYILLHKNELLPYLSPVHSPMLCTAIYMKKYQGIHDKIAAISPCIAKGNEFDETNGLVSYNITFAKLEKYIQDNRLQLPTQGAECDHIDSGLGSIYSMPGGLKENVEFILGKALRIDKSEGIGVVYKALDAFCKENKANLPAVFDVLNCAEGCNLGTGCNHNKTIFEVNTSMEKARKDAVSGREREYFEQLYQEYDKTLHLEDFMRRYRPTPVRSIHITEHDIENAYKQLDKHDKVARTFDCGACGSDTCHDMAIKIAKRVNIAENCIKKAYDDMRKQHLAIMNWQTSNIGAIQKIEVNMADIKELAKKLVIDLSDVDASINLYDVLTQDINKIASNVHIISLNASIEAARAGEHGRSFSVVADAIRTLAGETQAATSKITKATAGTKSVLEEMTNMVQLIDEDISKSYDSVRIIAASTDELLK